MSEQEPAWRKQLEHSLTELKTMGEQVGQQLGGAAKEVSEDAKEAWKKLEPRLGEAEVKLREATDDAVDQLKGMFGELKNSLRSLRDSL